MKKLVSLALALALVLALGLAVPALAVDLPEGWTPADGARDAAAPETVDAPVGDRYAATVTVDGVELDTTGLPGAPAGYLPLRLLAETDSEGYVEWYGEENSGFARFDGNGFSIDYNTLTLTLNFEACAVEAPLYYDPMGYTFVSVQVLDALETVSVNTNPELDVERYDITTSASDPMTIVTKNIRDTLEMGASMKSTLGDLVSDRNFTAENFKQAVGYFPMIINADTIIIAEVAEGKMTEAKADLQAVLEATQKSFECYMPASYEMAMAGQVVESPDGVHAMLIISADNEKAIELFNAAYPAA